MTSTEDLQFVLLQAFENALDGRSTMNDAIGDLLSAAFPLFGALDVALKPAGSTGFLFRSSRPSPQEAKRESLAAALDAALLSSERLRHEQPDETILAVGMGSSGRSRASFGIALPTGSRPNPSIETLLTVFASTIFHVLENSRKAFNAHLRESLFFARDTAEVLRKAAEELGPRFGADLCMISLKAMDGCEGGAALWVRPGVPAIPVLEPIPEALMAELSMEGTQVLVENLLLDPRGLHFMPAPEIVKNLPNPISLVAVPLPGTGGPTGVLAAVTGGGLPRAFDSDLLASLEPIAAELSRAISLSRLLDRERDHQRFLSGLQEVSAVLTSTSDPVRIQQDLCDNARRLLGVEASRFYCLDAMGDSLGLASQSGGEAFGEPRRSIPLMEEAHPVCQTFREKTSHTDPASGFHLFPVMHGETAHGVLGLYRRSPDSSLAERAPLYAALGGIALHFSRLVRTLEQHSERDPLTGLYSRDSIVRRLEIEIKRAERSGLPVTLANVRIEGISDVVKKFGPGVGGALLPKSANLLSRATRTVNVIGRDRDDRFLILIFDANKTQSHRAAEAIQKNFAGAQDPKLEEFGVTMKLSLGIAAYPEDAFDAQSLTLRAEEALDEAIRTGPGSIVLYGALSGRDSGFEF